MSHLPRQPIALPNIKLMFSKKLIQLNCAAKLPIFLLNKLFFRNTFEINIFKTQ